MIMSRAVPVLGPAQERRGRVRERGDVAREVDERLVRVLEARRLAWRGQRRFQRVERHEQRRRRWRGGRSVRPRRTLGR